MIKTLQKKFTLLYSVTTGIILTLVVVGISMINFQDIKKSHLNNFQNHILTLSSSLQSNSTISDIRLSELEGANALLIYIEDNQMPLLYKGSWNPVTERSILVERAQKAVMSEGIHIRVPPVSSSLIRSSIFRVKGDYGDSYYATVMLFKTTTGFRSLTLLSYEEPALRYLWQRLLLYFILDILGIVALTLVSWKFVGQSLRPIEENHRKQNEFIAAASHELRSPLAVIQTGLSTLSMEHPSDIKILSTAMKECGRMARLINDMLLLASADGKTWSLHLETIETDTLLIETFEAFEPVAKEKSQILHLDLPTEILPPIQGDRHRLQQVLTILLDNAISYTPEGKHIMLRGYLHKSWVVIEVEDQGIGIPDAMKARIFERFYRGDQSRNMKKHFGLGLSIASQLIELHKGVILVEDGEYGGAKFVVWLRWDS